MKPVLNNEIWHYCSVQASQLSASLLAASFAMVRETESVTLILPADSAKTLGQDNSTEFQRIELQVYSSLEAVGLTAAISQCLKEQNISANVIAGYHHDHVFVPATDASKAIAALQSLVNQAQ